MVYIHIHIYISSWSIYDLYIIIVHQPQEKVPYAVVANVSEGALELQLRPQEAASLLEDAGWDVDFMAGETWKNVGKMMEKTWENMG